MDTTDEKPAKRKRDTRGVIERRDSKGRRRFYIRYTDSNGVRHTKAAKGATSLDDARKLLAAAETNVMNRKAGIAELTAEEKRQRTITIGEIAPRHVAEYLDPAWHNPDDNREQRRSLFKARILPAFKDHAAAAITTDDVETFRDKMIRDGYAVNSIAITLSAISVMYEWANKKKLIACPSPTVGVSIGKGEPSMDYLHAPEVAALLSYAAEQVPDVFPMIATGLYAGMRKGELYGLTWRNVDLSREQITVAKSYRSVPKGGKTRHLPINAELAPILRAWKERCPKTAEGLVFPVDGEMGTRKDTHGLDKLLTAAGCHLPEDGHCWHMLRHTFASHYMMAGGSILDLKELLGHAKLEQVLVYAHLAPKHLAAGIARMTFAHPAAGVESLTDERRRREMDNGGIADSTEAADPGVNVA